MKKSELRAEINDRESERADLRDRVEKAEAALGRVRELAEEAQYRNSASAHWTEILAALDGA